MTELVTIQSFDFQETALVMAEDTSFEAWAAAGETLKRMDRAVQWWIGDWLVQGERAFGEKYSQALDTTGLAYQTVRSYSWVANAIPAALRHDTLPWSVYRELASLPPELLEGAVERAVAENWTVKQAHAEVRALLGNGHMTEESPAPTEAADEPDDEEIKDSDGLPGLIDPAWLPAIRELGDWELLTFLSDLEEHGWLHAKTRLRFPGLEG